VSGPADVLYHAAKRIGYYAPDDPEPGSEAGRYWARKTGQAWLAGPSTSIWWCMLFVSMCFDEAGQIDAIGGFSYNTDVTLAHIRNHPDAYFVSVGEAEPGDVVIFDWDSSTVATDHVGIVEANLGDGVLQTIEGNTSSGAYGSQSAGNGVWRRQRSYGIAYVIRPAWVGSGSSSAPAVKPSWWIDEDGVWGAQTGGRFRGVMGLDSSATWTEACKRFQVFLNGALDAYEIHKLTGDYKLEVDGVDGTNTWKCFQHFWNMSDIPGDDSLLEEDGVQGIDTTTKVQKTLNASWHGSQGLAKAP
jgi:hypothetical protein